MASDWNHMNEVGCCAVAEAGGECSCAEEVPESIVLDAQSKFYEVKDELERARGRVVAQRTHLRKLEEEVAALEGKLADYISFLETHSPDAANWKAEAGVE